MASGVGGAIGAVVLSVWGGFQQQVFLMLLGMIGTGLSKIVFGFGRTPAVWSATQFGASLFTPMVFSSYTAVWYAKVELALQGRVFAADHLIGLVIGAIASLVAGPLADRIFEPALQSGGPKVDEHLPETTELRQVKYLNIGDTTNLRRLVNVQILHKLI